jgi:hypothetical protein
MREQKTNVVEVADEDRQGLLREFEIVRELLMEE